MEMRSKVISVLIGCMLIFTQPSLSIACCNPLAPPSDRNYSYGGEDSFDSTRVVGIPFDISKAGEAREWLNPEVVVDIVLIEKINGRRVLRILSKHARLVGRYKTSPPCIIDRTGRATRPTEYPACFGAEVVKSDLDSVRTEAVNPENHISFMLRADEEKTVLPPHKNPSFR